MTPLPADTFAETDRVAACTRHADALPSLVRDYRDGWPRFGDLWALQDEHLTASRGLLADGVVTLVEHPGLDLAVVRIPAYLRRRTVRRYLVDEAAAVHPFAINSATKRSRILRVQGAHYEFEYRYESWVQLATRRVPLRVRLDGLARRLNELDGGAGGLRGSQRHGATTPPADGRRPRSARHFPPGAGGRPDFGARGLGPLQLPENGGTAETCGLLLAAAARRASVRPRCCHLRGEPLVCAARRHCCSPLSAGVHIVVGAAPPRAGHLVANLPLARSPWGTIRTGHEPVDALVHGVAALPPAPTPCSSCSATSRRSPLRPDALIAAWTSNRADCGRGVQRPPRRARHHPPDLLAPACRAAR